MSLVVSTTGEETDYCCSIMRCIRTFLTYISQVCNERNKLDFFFLEYYYFIIQWCGMFDPILSKSLLFLSGICNRWLLMYGKALNQSYRKLVLKEEEIQFITFITNLWNVGEKSPNTPHNRTTIHRQERMFCLFPLECQNYVENIPTRLDKYAVVQCFSV
jgi:hypothetical protein